MVLLRGGVVRVLLVRVRIRMVAVVPARALVLIRVLAGMRVVLPLRPTGVVLRVRAGVRILVVVPAAPPLMGSARRLPLELRLGLRVGRVRRRPSRRSRSAFALHRLELRASSRPGRASLALAGFCVTNGLRSLPGGCLDYYFLF